MSTCRTPPCTTGLQPQYHITRPRVRTCPKPGKFGSIITAFRGRKMSPDRMWMTRDPALPFVPWSKLASGSPSLRCGTPGYEPLSGTPLDPPPPRSLRWLRPPLGWPACFLSSVLEYPGDVPVRNDGPSGKKSLCSWSISPKKRRSFAGGLSQKSEEPRRGSRYLASHPLRYTLFIHLKSSG